ncbi:MAG: gamma-glutamyltransferase [bacterium]|nr:gamma-glutamyltransferase [bacterium]
MIQYNTIESSFKETEDGKCSESKKGMVAAAFPDATEAGVAMLKLGGNAVDAACAAAFALTVCEPQASGLGGQTMMVIGSEKKVLTIDGSSRVPSLGHIDSINEDDRSSGYKATTVPSTPAALWYVHEKYGRLPWKQILEPAISIAQNGYRITELQHRLQLQELERFSDSGKKYFLKEGSPYDVGDLFIQTDLARTLRILSEKGVQEFYNGSIAKQVDADMRENGGLLRYDDLALIPWPIERPPLKGKYRGLSVYSMPPPGSGRTLLFTLMMLNHIGPEVLNRDPAHKAYFLANLFRKALLERSERPFDGNFYPQMAARDILTDKYVRESINEISRSVDAPGETTHLSVIDNDGMAVSLTQSIERVYGSKAAADGPGFLYNNYLMDFVYNEPGHPFYLRPNAVPWATVAPTLIYNDRGIWMAVGSPGSERIFSSIAQFLIHIVEEGMSIGEAMTAPRIHCSREGRVSLEAERFPPEVAALFHEKAYDVDIRDPYAFYLGAIHAVLKKQDGSGFQGVAEIRRDGTSKGID